jgi:two-component system NarL family sensor kinase
MENNLYTLYLGLMAIIMVFAIGITLLVSIQKQKQADLLLLQKQMEFNHRNDILRARMEVQEKSMSLISEEIHDNVGQLLVLAVSYQKSALRSLSSGPAFDFLKLSSELLAKVTAQIRSIGHSLNSYMLVEMGLFRAIAREVESMESLGMRSSFESLGTQVTLTKEQDLLIFRIVQECLQNIMKHSQATECSIKLDYSRPGFLKMVVADNGKGFNPEKIDRGANLGLLSIRNRATLLKADMHLTTGANKGCVFELIIPTPENEH